VRLPVVEPTDVLLIHIGSDVTTKGPALEDSRYFAAMTAQTEREWFLVFWLHIQ
jgi:hypothetical protein